MTKKRTAVEESAELVARLRMLQDDGDADEAEIERVSRQLHNANVRAGDELEGIGEGWETDAMNLGSVAPRDIDWLWLDRIPLGMVTILCGPKAAGKGQIACSVIGAVTKGGALPAEGQVRVQVPQGNVIYVNAEDPREETIVPRLEESGADLARVTHLSRLTREVGEDKHAVVLTLAQHMKELREEVEKHRPILLVIDTLSSHAGADLISNSEMAPIMAGLSLLAEQFRLAVVLVHHPTKVPHARASSDVSGASCIATAARSVLMAGFDEGKERRALFHLDSNVGPEATPIGYDVAPFRWTGPTDLTLDETRRHGERRRGQRKAEAAEARLRVLLADGPRRQEEVLADLADNGISKAVCAIAKRQLAIPSQKLKKLESPTGESCWLWGRPGQSKDEAKAEYLRNGKS